MPSAARQRLPSDLWRQGQRKYSNITSSTFFSNQEMQANPGHYDIVTEDKQRPCNYRISHKSHKRPYNGRGSPKALPRGGSSETLSILVLSDSESNGSNSSTTLLSRSAESDHCLSSNSSRICDAYAMETAIAPHPSKLPFPPLEWLQSSLLLSSPTIDCGVSLQGLLSSQVAAL